MLQTTNNTNFKSNTTPVYTKYRVCILGIKKICLADLLNSQINDIYSSQPSEKDGNVTCLVLLAMRKIKETLAAKRRKQTGIKYRTYECMKCEMCENSEQSSVKTCICMHNNCMRLYGNLTAEYATHLLQKEQFENETYMNLGTPRKAYEFQRFFVRECRLFSCNLEYHEALLAKNRYL